MTAGSFAQPSITKLGGITALSQRGWNGIFQQQEFPEFHEFWLIPRFLCQGLLKTQKKRETLKIKYLLCGSFLSAAPRYPEALRLSQYLPVLESCLEQLKGLECPGRAQEGETEAVQGTAPAQGALSCPKSLFPAFPPYP